MTIYTVKIKGKIFSRTYKVIGDNVIGTDTLYIETPLHEAILLPIKGKKVTFSPERV